MPDSSKLRSLKNELQRVRFAEQWAKEQKEWHAAFRTAEWTWRRLPTMLILWLVVSVSGLFMKVRMGILRSEADIKADIAKLPSQRTKMTQLPPGTEMDVGANRRLFISVKYGEMLASDFKPEPGTADIADRYTYIAAQNLSDLRTNKDCTIFGGHIKILQYSADASYLKSLESDADPYGGGRYDWTTIEVDFCFSKAVIETIVDFIRQQQAILGESTHAQIYLSVDVSSEMHLRRRDLAPGQGAHFVSISSGPFKPHIYHLHAFAPPPWREEQSPPDNYALSYPIASCAFEEYFN